MANGIYDEYGAIRYTSVDGSSWTGLYAADGGVNVVLDDTTYNGLYHPCGAWRVNTGTNTNNQAYDASGAYYLSTLLNTPNNAPSWVLRASGRPANIDLDFVNGRYWGGQLTDLTTFSRSSTGYAQDSSGVLTNFGSGVPRITDLGYFIEDGRTNFCTRSQELDNATWTKTAVSVSPDTTSAPDGTTTADTLTANGTVGAQYILASATISFTSGTTYTWSIYVKASSHQWVQLTLGAAAFSGLGYANFDLTNGVAGNTGGTVTGSGIAPLGNGWYRIWLSAPATATTSASALLYMVGSGIASRATAATSSGSVIIWGAQVEAGTVAIPTSYVPTTTAASQRNGDVLLANGLLATILKSSGYSYNIKATAPLILVSTFNSYLLQSSDGTLNNRIDTMIISPSGNVGFRHSVGGVSSAPGDISSAFAAGETHNVSRMVSTSVDTTWKNGVLGTTAAQTAMPVVTQANIGQGFSGQSLNSFLKRLTVWSSPTSMLGVNP
jgi:hypothetical protein